ncbi:hypothetical protein ElP_76270 (plasmid) [Tautonia plasticadhaerens]|uniref:ParB-like N-terminal domain-containing protein n=2 Tax=Tautonia plasticadhaerens TaxID=2527974 RepID=A0A518HFP0_9BACT|nr:hypothetical protein ElP_76270 [Tautonia plasticadhaerens]
MSTPSDKARERTLSKYGDAMRSSLGFNRTPGTRSAWRRRMGASGRGWPAWSTTGRRRSSRWPGSPPTRSSPAGEFDEEAIGRLAESLRARGQLQNVVVFWSEDLGSYVLVSGERRCGRPQGRAGDPAVQGPRPAPRRRRPAGDPAHRELRPGGPPAGRAGRRLPVPDGGQRMEHPAAGRGPEHGPGDGGLRPRPARPAGGAPGPGRPGGTRPPDRLRDRPARSPRGPGGPGRSGRLRGAHPGRRRRRGPGLLPTPGRRRREGGGGIGKGRSKGRGGASRGRRARRAPACRPRRCSGSPAAG